MIKYFVLAILLSITSGCSAINNKNTDEPSRAVASYTKTGEYTSERTILAETQSPKDIKLNGKPYSRCYIYSRKGITTIDKKEVTYIGVGIESEDNKQFKKDLFMIREDGSYVYRWYYPDSDVVANNVTDKQIGYGYIFQSNNDKIYYSNGSKCTSRNQFKLEIESGNLNAIKSVSWKDGMCNAGQIAMAIPSILTGSDNMGNDLKCKF